MQDLNSFLPQSIAGRLKLAWSSLDENYSTSLLNEQEKRACQDFGNVQRRHEYIVTRILFKKMIQSQGLDPTAFRLKKDPLGRPFGVYKKQQFFVSIAHSQNSVLCAIARYLPIGIDLEPVDRKVPGGLRNRMLNESEQPLLQKESSVRIWTLKEALVKLQGSGMRTNLNEWTLRPVSKGLFAAELHDDKSANICSFSYQKNWLAIAWPRNKTSVKKNHD